jgi:hypothetical protein
MPATLAGIGVTSQHLSEARDIALTIGPAQITATVEEANDRGQALSRGAAGSWLIYPLVEVDGGTDLRGETGFRLSGR